MALKASHKDIIFGVGDRIRISQTIKEGTKSRLQAFEGMVIGIKGRGVNKSILLRKIGIGQVGIEKIYPLASPTIEKIKIIKKGFKGIRRAKLYYTRTQSRKEIDKIYSRAAKREKKVSPRKSKKK